MKLELIDVSISSCNRTLLNTFSLQIDSGEIILVVGPSGAGKSTLLNYIAGFIPVIEKKMFSVNKWFAGSNTGLSAIGQLIYEGKDISNLRPEERTIGMVNQKYSIYPHLTGIENIAFPLKCQGIDIKNRVEIAHQLADKVLLSQEVRFQKASELSGGEQQRLAIAKMLARKSTIGLLDEPFSHLDPLLRKELTELIFSLIKMENNDYFNTAFIVSHDWNDIQYADKIVLVVDSKSHSSNVVILSLENSIFRPTKPLDSEIKIQWVNEINTALRNN